MTFLEKGRRPEDGVEAERHGPFLHLRRGRIFRASFPIVAVLIDIALQEKRFNDAVALYEQQTEGNRRRGSRDKEVAQAVESSHPDVALSIRERLPPPSFSSAPLAGAEE